MKKVISIVLCLAMLLSILTLSSFAAEENSIADVFAEFGLKPTYAPDMALTAPVADGVVDTDEYTYVREFTNLSDSYVGKTFEEYSDNYNFGFNCHPNNNVVIKEYVAQDADNIYIAFEFGQDLKNFQFRFNPAQDTIYDCASSTHAMQLEYKIPALVDKDNVADVKYYDSTNYAGETEFRLLYDGDDPSTSNVENDEYDGIVQRNFEEDATTFKNITAEFRFSKQGILDATFADDDEVEIFSYYCKGKRVEGGAGVAEGGDVTLQWTPPIYAIEDKYIDEGFMSADEWIAEYYPIIAVEKMASKYQMFRFVCFREDPSPFDPSTTTPGSTTNNGSTLEPADPNSLIDLFAEYGLKPTYAPDMALTAPVADGVVDTDEYTYVREFTNLSDPYVGKTFYEYSNNYNFGLNCHPNNSVVIKEYIAQDEENIYIAFEVGQDLSDFQFRFNPAQDTVYDCASSHNAMELRYDIPEGVNSDSTARVRWYNETNVYGEAEFAMLYDDEYDGIVRRNFESSAFKNITAEFRFSKQAILDSTFADDDEVEIFSYYCKGSRVQAGAGLSSGFDVTLQWTVPYDAMANDLVNNGYLDAEEWLAEYYTYDAADYVGYRNGQMFRFVCFYEDPDYIAPDVPQPEGEPVQTPDTVPVQVIYQEIVQADVVYSVDVAFGSMKFTYSAGGEGIWNPDTHNFDSTVSEGWYCSNGENEVSVINHSNAAVAVSLRYDKADNYSAIAGAFDKPLINLASAVNTDVAFAPADTAKLTLSGAYSGSTTVYDRIGTVTVTITKG